jgi:cell division protein FtsB
MTTKTKKQGSIGLGFIWKLRLQLRAEGNKLWAEGDKLRAEGDKLRAEGNKLWAEGNKLWAEGNKLWAEGDKLRAEGDKLRAEGNKLWAEGILEAYGNIKLGWKYVSEKEDYECHLENGEVFKP